MQEPLRILFVCSGNICRSPMAEAIAIAYARERGRPVEVKSASSLGFLNTPAEPNAIAVMKEIELDIQPHRSQPLTRDLVDWADHVLVMEVEHAQKVREMQPRAEEKVMLLGTFVGTLDIPDPMGGWKGRFRKTRDIVQMAVERYLDQLPPLRS